TFNTPNPRAASMMGGMTGPLDDTDFNVLTINVVVPTADPVTGMPAALTTNQVWPQSGTTTRNINFSAQPMMSMTNFFINNEKFDMEEMDFTTEQEDVEVWNITNQTMMAHPFHIHGNHFYVLQVNGATPPPNMRGRKDVVAVPPMNGSVKLVTKYANFGDPNLPYMFHCHILSHEDGGMMRQFIVNPAVSATNEPAQQGSLTISPNPVASGGFLQINLTLAAAGALEFTLSDLGGRTVRQFDLGEKAAGNQDLSLETKGLAAGAYFLTARLSGKQVGAGKVVVE
ncbi:MAG: multicopper oxidase domain-containing protein, partial [Bacteroidetes bacterium]|nr:multicopper oxidase domain-containing protein [Bacteroidota bacterium]